MLRPQPGPKECIVRPLRFAVFFFLVAFAAAQPLNPLAPTAGSFLDADATVLGRRADSAYQAASYLDAARLYLEALHANPASAGNIYNLACCYGLLGKDTLAARFLERAAKAGYNDVEHVRRDPDFDRVRDRPVFACAVESIAARAEREQEGFGRREYYQASSYLSCRVHLPDGYDSTRTYKLIIGLHGYGGTADRFAILWQRFPVRDFIYASPEAPYQLAADKEVAYSWGIDTETDSATDRRAYAMSEAYVVDLTRQLARRYAFKDVYLLGFSQGAGLAYTTGLRNPTVFKGVAAFGGWLDTLAMPGTVTATDKALRIFIAHGASDRVIEPKAATDARDRLMAKSYDVTYHTFDGGHQVAESAVRKFMDWLNE
jgi:predicted esterase